METVRVFIALDIGTPVRKKLIALQKELNETGADVRWVKPENLHLTLAFLGNIATDKLNPLTAAVQQQTEGLNPFILTVHGAGVFGRRNRPSVVWAGIKDSPPLDELYQQVIAALGAVEIPFHNKRFRPHLTLGRFNSLSHLNDLFGILKQEQDTTFGNIEIRSLQLIKSELKPSGAEHAVLEKITLRC